MSKRLLPWTLWLALRFVLSPKRERWTGFISLIALLGVAISVTALTTVNAVMTGFKRVIYEKVLSLNPHLMITYLPEDKDEVVRVIKTEIPEKEIVGLQEVSILQGLLLKQGRSLGVIVKGVDLNQTAKEVAFRRFEYQKTSPPDVLPIIVGERLKQKLGLTPGEELSLLTSEGIHTPFGFFPKVYSVWVAGFFESGVYDYDLSLVFTPHSQLKGKVEPKERVIEVKLRDPFLSSELKNRLIKDLGLKARVVDWQELNRNLFSALKLEKFGLFVVLSLMVGVSLFTVISAMVMLVSEKRLDLGILRALGAKKKEVERLFFFCGFILSFFGVVLGLALGSILCLVLSKYPVIKLPEEVYPVEYLPISLEVSDLILISAVTLVLGVLSALYPARKASGLNPAEILRKEG